MATMSIEASHKTPAVVLSSARYQVAPTRSRPRKAGVALWVVQALLAALFLFAGGLKLAMPLEMLAAVAPLPAVFLKFIGTCEVLGALGLVLPGLLRIRPGLTPLAAAGLVIVMIGATVTTVLTMGVASAIVPFVVGLLAASVAFGRSRVVPLSKSARRPARRIAGHAPSRGLASA